MDWIADNWIALLSLLIAAASLAVAFRSNRKSSRAENRATERNHVNIDLDMNPEDGTMILKNTGSGRALNLEGTITVNEETQSVWITELGSNSEVTMTFPGIREEFLTYASAVESTRYPAPSMAYTDSMYPYGWSLIWTTPAGNVGASDSGALTGFFPDPSES